MPSYKLLTKTMPNQMFSSSIFNTQLHKIKPQASPSSTQPPLQFLPTMDTSWVLFAISLFSIFSLIFFLKTKSTTKKGQLPPSPPTVPVIGNLLWLRKSLLEISPFLRRLRSSLGPVVSLNFGPFPAIFIVDRDFAHQAFVQKGAAFSDRPHVLPSGATAVFSSNGYNISSGRGTLWRLLRRNLTAEILSTSRVKSYSNCRKSVMESLLRDINDQADTNGGVVVVMEAFRRAMYRMLVWMCFGKEMEDEVVEKIQKVQRGLLKMGLKLTFFDILPVAAKFVLYRRWKKFLELRRQQEELFIPLIRARRDVVGNGGGGNGLVSYLDSLLDLELPEEENRKLTEKEIVSLISEFLNAGIDTTATTLEWAMANLIKRPNIQQKLVQEITTNLKEEQEETSIIGEESLQSIPYLKAIILETLRLHPPAQFLLPHATTEDVNLGPYTIPRGSAVNVTVAEMGWDESVWEEPSVFRPERFLVKEFDVTGSKEIKMIPFGVGRRICPGIGLAMVHLEYFLANLVKEFEWGVAEEGEDVDMSEELEFTVIMKNRLRSRVHRRGDQR